MLTHAEYIAARPLPSGATFADQMMPICQPTGGRIHRINDDGDELVVKGRSKRSFAAMHLAAGKKQAAATLERYTKAFDGKIRTASQLSKLLGISRCGVLKQLRIYNDKGIASRVGICKNEVSWRMRKVENGNVKVRSLPHAQDAG